MYELNIIITISIRTCGRTDGVHKSTVDVCVNVISYALLCIQAFPFFNFI